jgi:hypothetical protein
MYVTRATDGMAATYPTLSHRVMLATNHHALSGSLNAAQYCSVSKFMVAAATPPLSSQLELRDDLS